MMQFDIRYIVTVQCISGMSVTEFLLRVFVSCLCVLFSWIQETRGDIWAHF